MSVYIIQRGCANAGDLAREFMKKFVNGVKGLPQMKQKIAKVAVTKFVMSACKQAARGAIPRLARAASGYGYCAIKGLSKDSKARSSALRRKKLWLMRTESMRKLL